MIKELCRIIPFSALGAAIVMVAYLLLDFGEIVVAFGG